MNAAGRRAGARTQPACLALLLAVLSGCGEAPPALLEGRPDGPYRLTLALDPSQPAPGVPTQLTWQLTQAADGAPVTDLDVVHERVMHNFIVNLDFSQFAHIHHEDFRTLTPDDLARARFTLPYTFPSAGRYRVVSEFSHRRRGYIKHFDFVVGDPPAQAPGPRVVELSRARTRGPYAATLRSSPAAPVAGYETELVLALSRDGAPVTDLALLLGSEVHVAVWRSDGQDFGHTHSYTPHMAMMLADMHAREVDPATRAARLADLMAAMIDMPVELVFPGPQVPVRYVFPAAGLYQVYLQCAPGGVPEVFHFMVEVIEHAPGVDTRLESMVDPHLP